MESGPMPPRMESPGEDHIMLIETVKSIVTHDARNGAEDFFLIPQNQAAQYSETNVDQAASSATVTLDWMHLCRICANACERMIPIFEGDGMEHDLASKILKHLPIHVCESDTLPLQLCENCANILIAWHELSEGCLNAERKLLEMQETRLQSKQQYYSAPLDNLEVTAPILTTADTTITSNITNSLPENQQEENKNEVHKIEKNNKSNRWTRRVSKDESKKRTRVSSSKSKRLNMQKKECVNIKKDQSAVSSKKSLSWKHLDRSDEKLKKDRSNNSETQESHAINLQKCTQQLEQDDELTRSLTKEHVSYKCEDCGKVLSTSYNLLIHRNIHSGVRPYVCSVCNKNFRSASGRNRHIQNVHEDIKNFACDICGRHLASRTSRDEHMRTHSNERPYVCETCGKSFKQKASLYVHQLYHSQVLPHRCNVCNRGFRRKQELENHASRHSAQKPHACDICDERFHSKGCVVRHRRVHTSQRSHICTICDAKFTQERYLKRHCSNLHPALCT
ncbi:hypothetical protein PUN28_013880 [Cardiocondyla obscurior]|uniref:Uncharacterized protein n=1 Tax=Cardiocondyla obscurior TaxID=286306 RepID=A0AAW2F3V1_9HYME